MGKSLQPLNAMAVRPPNNTPAAAANAASEPITAESLGWQLRAALPPLRLHSVSLFDEQANVLWLSEGALGPDEHNVVLDAMEQLSNDRSLPCYENGLEDGRVGIFLPVRAPQGDLVGVAMILADLKSVGDGVLEKIVSPQVRTIMQKVAVLLRAASPRQSEAPTPIPVAIAPVLELTPERAPERAPTPARAAAAISQPAAPLTASIPPAPAKAAAAAASRPATNTKANGFHAAAAPNTVNAAPAATPGRAGPASIALTPPAAAPVQDSNSLSPQAIDDILEFELFPNLGESSEEEVPKSPASSFLAESLAWNPAGPEFEMTGDASPPVVQAEPVKPAPVVQPARVAAPPAAAAKAAAPSKAASAQAAVVAQASSLAHSAPAPATSAVASAPVAQSASATFSSFDLSLPAELLSPASAPASLSQAVAAAATPSAIVVPNVPTLHAPNAVPTVAPVASESSPAAVANSTSSAVPKSTGATTTTKALGNGATTGAAKSLNGGTGVVQAINGNGTSATVTSRTIALDPSSLILDVQPFSKLRPGGRMRRYEVLPRIPHRDANRAPAAMDGLALQRLLSWLGSNRSAWNLEPTSFSLNLSISTLEDERFPQQVAQSLKANGIAPDNLGFEIAEPLCTQRRAQVERFISLCDKLGCFVVIDDFSFDSSVLPLLRSKALRLVKIDPKLTSAALRDKLSQAMVVAIVQAVKVLGIHCAAKRVESQASLQWLTAIGCDLAQGPALSQVLPIESLNMPAAPAAEAGKAAS
jgi:EAL domain-containing protein (putative c-di-GMP-specific phosphodiesterase class I)